jgi:hypothetical protein
MSNEDFINKLKLTLESSMKINNSKFYSNLQIVDLDKSILPSLLEEELLLAETSFEEQSKLSRNTTDMSKDRCDLVKYLYILRLLSIMKANKFEVPFDIQIEKY